MPVDPKYKGKKYLPAYKYEVGLEKIKEYAMAVGDLNPLYINEEEAAKSKYGGIIAPPTFAAVYARGPAGQALFDPELSLDLPMLVHGEQEFEFFEVVKPGDVILTEGEILDIFEKTSSTGTLDFVVVGSTSRRKKDQKVVCTGKWTFVVRRQQ